MEDYLDDHKERAFKSSFMEPARFYYDAVSNHMGRDHVNVHGLNWVRGREYELLLIFHRHHLTSNSVVVLN